MDVDKEVEKAEECKSLETGKLVEEKVDISDNIVLRKLLVSWSNIFEVILRNIFTYKGLVWYIFINFSLSGGLGTLILQIVVGEHVIIVVKKDIQLWTVRQRSGRGLALFAGAWSTMRSSAWRFVEGQNKLFFFLLSFCLLFFMLSFWLSLNNKLLWSLDKMVIIPVVFITI